MVSKLKLSYDLFRPKFDHLVCRLISQSFFQKLFLITYYQFFPSKLKFTEHILGSLHFLLAQSLNKRRAIAVCLTQQMFMIVCSHISLGIPVDYWTFNFIPSIFPYFTPLRKHSLLLILVFRNGEFYLPCFTTLSVISLFQIISENFNIKVFQRQNF